jgi:hypothetical protein
MNKKLQQRPVVFLTVFVLLLLTTVFSAGAQDQITGSVRDNAGPMTGVGVLIKGTSVSTQTDANGKFSITSPGGQDVVLVFSYIGYTSQEVPVSGTQPINVTLAEASESLGEVVVIGYGTQRKQDLTGAVSVVKASDVQKRQATTLAESLQGLATFRSGE